jgi:hypothetical protein
VYIGVNGFQRYHYFEPPMRKVAKYGLWTIAIILIVGAVAYLSVRQFGGIFPTPQKEVLDYDCDYEGLRQAELFIVEGNAVTNSSIHVAVRIGCYASEGSDEKVVFSADNWVNETDVSMEWSTFDTLKITYKKGLRLFKQENTLTYTDSTLNVYIAYKERE